MRSSWLIVLALAGCPAAVAAEPSPQLKLVDTLRGGHAIFVRSVVFSSDGKLLATVGNVWGNNDHLRIWDVERRCVVAALPYNRLDAYLGTIAFSPDGKTLLSALGKQVQFRDIPGSKETATLELPKETRLISLSPDGKTLVTEGEDLKERQVLLLWDVATRKITNTLQSTIDLRGTIGLSWSRDGKILATHGDHQIEVWDVANAKASPAFEVFTDGYKYNGNIAFSPDCDRAVVINEQGRPTRLILWDTKTGKQEKVIHKFPQDTVIRSKVVWSKAGNTVAVARVEEIELWDITTGKKTSTIEHRLDEGGRTGIALSPDGKLLATAGRWFVADEARLWNAANGELVDTLRPYFDQARRLVFSRDGKMLAVTDYRYTDVWEMKNRKHLFSMRKEEAAAFSPDGKTVAFADQEESVIHLVNTADGKTTKTLTFQQFLKGLAFSPDGKQLLSADSDMIRSWDMKADKPTSVVGAIKDVTHLAFSQDGKRLWMGERWLPAARVIEADTGKTLFDLPFKVDDVKPKRGPITAAALAFSSDGKTAARGLVGVVELWDVDTGKQTGTWKGHDGQICCIALSEDGKWLATGGADKTVKVWDVARGKVVETSAAHPGPVCAVAFSPDGVTLVAAAGGTDQNGATTSKETLEGTLSIWEWKPTKRREK